MLYSIKAILSILSAYLLETDSYSTKIQINHTVISPINIRHAVFNTTFGDIITQTKYQTPIQNLPPTKTDKKAEKTLYKTIIMSSKNYSDTINNPYDRRITPNTVTMIETKRIYQAYENITSPTDTNGVVHHLSQERVTLAKQTGDQDYYQTHKNKAAVPTNIDKIDSNLTRKSITMIVEIDNLKINVQSQENTTAPIQKNNSDQYKSLRSLTSPIWMTNPDDLDPSYRRASTTTKTYKTKNWLSKKDASSPRNNENYDQLNETVTSPTKNRYLTQEILTTTIKTNYQKNYPPNIDRLLPNRRQDLGQSKPFHPPSDSEIARLLNQYRAVANKYKQGNRNVYSIEADFSSENPGETSHANDTKQFNMGQRGPIHHNLRWSTSKSTHVIRQGYDDADDREYGQGFPTSASTVNANAALSGKPGEAQQTTQNEAQGAASRFTTRMTTTRRRRRTTPNRVSFSEDCDYLAYYCLKAYDTGIVCARTMYQNFMTFKNYCMVDFVNCMERFDVWRIVHMGQCFRLHLPSEYMPFSYYDESFLDRYHVIDDI